MKVDPTFLHLFAGLLVNLSAGWLAAAFILPSTRRLPAKFNDYVLSVDIALGLASFLGAYIIESILL